MRLTSSTSSVMVVTLEIPYRFITMSAGILTGVLIENPASIHDPPRDIWEPLIVAVEKKASDNALNRHDEVYVRRDHTRIQVHPESILRVRGCDGGACRVFVE